MKEHDGCAGCKYFSSDEVKRDSPCYDCEGAHSQNILKDNYTPMTNADRIRKMTDEELAEFLIDVSNNCEQITLCNEECDKCGNDNEVCIELCRLWLQKEVEE